MAQCTKILPSGEQCSNRAVPGTQYCETHGRIQFRPVASSPAPARPPQESGGGKQPTQKVAKKRKSKTTEPLPSRARPISLGEPPRFPGVRADARNILVADEGLIWLREGETPRRFSSLGDRLAVLLGCLSQKIRLPDQVDVQMDDGGRDIFIRLKPRDLKAVEPSRFYDDVAEATMLSDGKLYIGQSRTFIQYRDASAPRGYDAEGIPLPGEDELYLVNSEGTQVTASSALKSAPYEELLLRIAPVPALGTESPGVIYALAAAPLYRILARYFMDHYLRYRVAQLLNAKGDASVLFEVRPREDAPTGSLVPAFIISYLSALPRTVVLTDASPPNAGNRLLVEWRYRYPCRLQNVSDAFQSGSLVAFTTSPDYQSLYAAPAPTFFEGDDLTAVKMLSVRPISMTPVTTRKGMTLELPVRLTNDAGPTQLTAALLLEEREVEWMRQLVYKLPEDAFTGYSICLGKERAVLVGDGVPIEALPFGIPMQRVQSTNLFIQLRTRFVPELSWPLLSRVLSIEAEQYTFLTLDFRLDVPRKAFAPLSKMLVAEHGRPRVTLNVFPKPELPELKWQPPPMPERPPATPAPEQQLPSHRREEETSLSWWGRLRGQQPSAPRREPSPSPVEQSPQIIRAAPVPTQDIFKARAEDFIQKGDYLSAAFCYVLTGDNINAAKYYRAAAERIKLNNKEGGGRAS
jgi:hypothetical protein